MARPAVLDIDNQQHDREFRRKQACSECPGRCHQAEDSSGQYATSATYADGRYKLLTKPVVTAVVADFFLADMLLMEILAH